MTQTDWPATENRSSWLTSLGEAALLPTSDARRQAVEAEVARRGGWIRDEWLALISEEERLRLALHRPSPPDDLSSSLMALPDGNWPLRLLPASLRRNSGLVVAALALMAVGIGVAMLFRGQPADEAGDRSADRPSAQGQALHEVALLSISDHLDTHDVEFVAKRTDELERQLRGVLPFDVSLPDLSGSFDLVGGRKCTLGSHPAAFSSWRSDRGTLTVLQLRCVDFGLPRALPLRHVSPPGAAARKHEGGAVLLGRDGFLWVCVADDPGDLARARAQLERWGVERD